MAYCLRFKEKIIKLSVPFVIIISILLFFHASFGLSSLNPLNTEWLLNNKDQATHFLGWQFFRNDDWTFPLGTINSYNYPIGTNIGYTDSIPLLAIFFKLLSPILPYPFQYTGIWLFSCFLLQAFFAYLLIRKKTSLVLIRIVAVLILTLTPILIVRHIHPSLCAQWLILASIWIYLSEQNTRKKILIQFLLLIFSAFTHPYLCIMVSLFSFSLFSNLIIKKKIKLISFILNTVLSIIAVLLIWHIIGYFSLGPNWNDYGAGGYDYFSIDLNTFFNPSTSTSYFIPTLPTKSTTYESYNYLGSGVILLLIIVIIFSVKNIKIIIEDRKKYLKKARLFIKNHIVLIISLASLSFFALGNNISFNGTVIFSYPLNENYEKLIAPLRASSRFIWPAYYMMLIFIIFAFIKKLINNLWLIGIFIIALSLQIGGKNFIFPYNMEKTLLLNNTEWSESIAQADKILIFPAYKELIEDSNDDISFAYLAAINKKAINLGNLARNNIKRRDRESKKLRRDLVDGRIQPKTLYITTQKYDSIINKETFKDKLECKVISGYTACLSKDTN
ncbi:MAG: DUF6311 domain-containing protein [bacterium]